MKKIFLFLITISIFSFSSCKKEEIIDSNIEPTIDKQSQPAMLYRLLSCVYISNGVEYSGYECVTGAFEQCLNETDCHPIEYEGGWLPLPTSFPIDWGFTPEEEERWDLGEDIMENSDEFIESHYDFFVFMYESGIILHPDTIMKYND